MDDTPSYISSPEQKPSKKKTIWLVIIILALIASNVMWALFFVKQQGELNTKISILTAKNVKLTNDNKDLQKADSKDDDTTVYREIPELGVKYKVTNQTKDLTYAYNFGFGQSSIGFSSTALVKAANANNNDGTTLCGSSNGAAGIITSYKTGDKVDTAADSTPVEQVKDAKKVGNNYFIITKPQGVCSEDKTIQALDDKAIEAAEAAFASLKAI
ncbi:MAG: hypothetical protein Q7T74_01380 [Candidatus Saccharibacteria bacterium]|nr:hypothetical protein [Candidatus Saccharibacteria bacterium]